MDGDLFVKTTLCVDAIMKKLCDNRKDTILCFLGTPTDIHGMTKILSIITLFSVIKIHILI